MKTELQNQENYKVPDKPPEEKHMRGLCSMRLGAKCYKRVGRGREVWRGEVLKYSSSPLSSLKSEKKNVQRKRQPLMQIKKKIQ